MTETRWTVDRPDGTSLELGGHKFASNDKGARMKFRSLDGKHVYIACCPCDVADVQHINDSSTSNPDKPKDAITHARYWRRSGASSVILLRSFRL